MHMHCGQPTRAPQIGSMIWRNTAEGELRNIMVIFGQVVTLTKSMKHVALKDTPWISAHFLPPRLAQLLLRYLIFIRLTVKRITLNRRQLLTQTDYLFKMPTDLSSQFHWDN